MEDISYYYYCFFVVVCLRLRNWMLEVVFWLIGVGVMLELECEGRVIKLYVFIRIISITIY